MDKTAILWDASTGEKLRTLEGHTASVVCVAFSPNDRHGINRYTDPTLNLRFAAEDARAMARLFSERGGQFYGKGKVHVTVLVDEQAFEAKHRTASFF